MKMLEITHLVWYTILDMLFLTKNTFNLNHDDQAYLAEGIRAAMFLADNKIKGFVHLTPCKDGYTVSEFIPPRPLKIYQQHRFLCWKFLFLIPKYLIISEKKLKKQ